jgi:hypothetical protein
MNLPLRDQVGYPHCPVFSVSVDAASAPANRGRGPKLPYFRRARFVA